jgi:MFS family permease
MKSLPDPAAQFAIVWPLYWLALTIPLSLQMLAHTRTNQLTWRMVAGFCLMMVGPVAYSGYAVGVGDAWRYGGDIVSAGLLMATCWFILLPFAEHRLTRQRWFSDYSLLFASAWRNTIKLLSATVFTGLFWLLLLLWAQLFGMLKIHVFSDLFRSPAFIYPVTAIAYGIGLSLYATKEEALVNVYQTSLTILGWLLPLIACIMLLFLATLPIAGLNALWKTGSATALMLSMQGLMVFLFNAAWQDADHIHEGLGFLPQHIKLSNLFELSLQAVNPSLSLPYWEFTEEVAANKTVYESV